MKKKKSRLELKSKNQLTKNKLNKLGFIGCGHLAKCLIAGLEKSDNFQILGFDILEANHQWLRDKGHKAVELEACCNEANIIFLCVKPQDMSAVCQSISPLIHQDQKIISVAAGVKLQTLLDALPSKNIFRVMTNVGTKDNLGVTAIFSNNDNAEILDIFNYLGRAFEVVNEDQIDTHTVLVGSGPAFFFELISEFESRLTELVEDKDSKREITILFLTSLMSAIKNGENLDDLIDSVASKGGTTEAGLKLLREQRFAQIFSEAVDKGIQRAKELS